MLLPTQGYHVLLFHGSKPVAKNSHHYDILGLKNTVARSPRARLIFFSNYTD
jgi:hypothetical protein